jgi:hypothetical protein
VAAAAEADGVPGETLLAGGGLIVTADFDGGVGGATRGSGVSAVRDLRLAAVAGRGVFFAPSTTVAKLSAPVAVALLPPPPKTPAVPPVSLWRRSLALGDDTPVNAEEGSTSSW